MSAYTVKVHTFYATVPILNINLFLKIIIYKYNIKNVLIWFTTAMAK